MTRPRKKTVHCRNLAAAKQNQVTDDVDVGEQTESDDEVLLLDDVVITESCQDQVLEQMLVWKDGATLPSRSAYTGDSRWTAWRRDVKKQRLLDSSSNVTKIWDFFPKKIPDIPRIILESPILLALKNLNAQINLTPNAVQERQNRGTTKWDFIRKVAVRNYLQSLSEKGLKTESSEKLHPFFSLC
jgi:hypothetical protein